MENLNQFVLFDLGEETYALPTASVRKIDSIRKHKVRHVPNTPNFIRGIITLEDDIITLVSLSEKFSINSNVSDQDSYVIVCNLKEKNLSAGFIVDAVHDVIEFPDDYELSNVNEVITGYSTKFISGIYRLNEGEKTETDEDNEKLVIILDIEKLLSNDTSIEDVVEELKDKSKDQ